MILQLIISDKLKILLRYLFNRTIKHCSAHFGLILIGDVYYFPIIALGLAVLPCDSGSETSLAQNDHQIFYVLIQWTKLSQKVLYHLQFSQ